MADTINEMRAKGITVNDDNKPVEENLPSATNTDTGWYEEKWTGDNVGICNRRKAGHRFERASFISKPTLSS